MTAKGAALIVGGSTGIGLAIARQFAAQGHDLLLIGRDAERLRDAAWEIRNGSSTAVHVLSMDGNDDDAPTRALALLDRLGLPLGYAVIGLGAWHAGSQCDLTPVQLRGLLDANIVSQHTWQRALIPRIEPGGGLLVVGSLAGCVPMPGIAAYAASKAYLQASVMALRDECAARRVAVCLLAPGLVRTGFIPFDATSPRRRLLDVFASSPATVAHAAVLGLKSNTRLIVPGLLWRFLWFCLRILPATVVAGILRIVACALPDEVSAAPATGRSG